MRLCWADKIPLAVFAAITATLFALGNLGNSDAFSLAWWLAFASIEWLIFYKIILGPWIVLRIIDLVAGGRGSREQKRAH